MRLRVISADGDPKDLSILSSIARLGRDSSCEVAIDPGAYPKVSGEHARIDRTPSGLILTHLSRNNKTLLNDEPIEGAIPVKPGDRIRLGYTGPTIEIIAIEPARLGSSGSIKSTRSAKPVGGDKPPGQRPDTPASAAKEDFGATVQADSQHLGLLRGSLAAQRFEIGRGGVIGREKASAQFLLEHPHVSRRHAVVKVSGGQAVLADLGSANGTYVNGRRIVKEASLSPGDRIDIGPFSLRFDGANLVSLTRSNNIELAARRLRRVVKDRASGAPLTLLHDVSLVIRPREFVCLLGPSGSGKSTLLAMLSGRNSPDRGLVSVNGEDLYESFAALKQDIAVVPQKDVLHDSLSVSTALRYTAELRLPPDTAGGEIESSVSDILAVVGLSKKSDTLIRHLSGGQVKRASLANELIARPSLLFLDEVTSGLDEQTDREMMELFREVADSGKTVICITHSLANVEATCHLVVILTEGGRLAFVGTPEQAREYFGVPRLGDVYRMLGQREPGEWQAAFRAHPLYAHYVRNRMPDDVSGDEAEHVEREAEVRVGVNPLRQAWILTRRYVAIWHGDPQALATMLGQSLLVALLLAIVFGRLGDVQEPLERAQRTLNLLFLLSVGCFWFGCNNAAKELVKERTIYSRERDFNLRVDSYFVSKFVVLVVIALIQVTLLFGIARSWCSPPGSVLCQWLALAVVAVAGTSLGLLISALARTEEVAVALVPIAVMPQIILAGVIAPLSGLAKALARGAITVHWSEQALESLLQDSDLRILRLEPVDFFVALSLVLVHAAAFATGTLFILRNRSAKKAAR